MAVDGNGYSGREVEHLAAVLTDARLRGVWAGSSTLARMVLDAGYRRCADPVPGWVDPTGQREYEPVKRGAYELARETLTRRFGTVDPVEVSARGGDPVEVGAAQQLARLDSEPTSDTAH